MVSPQFQPIQPLTQHVDIGGSSHSCYRIAGTTFPAPVGLLGQWSKNEAAIAVHLGLAPQSPAHLQNHWSALRTHAAKGATHLSRLLVSSPPCLCQPAPSHKMARGTEAGTSRQSRVRNLTLTQEIVGGGSPLAEQGMSSSRPTSWKYSSLGRSIKAGGA